MKETGALFSAEEQLKNFSRFLENHDKQMKKLLKYISTSQKNTFDIHKEAIVGVNCSLDRECISLFKLMDYDRVLSKTILTFTFVCTEIQELLKDAKKMELEFLFLDENLIVMDSEDSNGNSAIVNDQVMLKMSKSIQFLFNLQCLLQRCFLISNNLLHQCGAYLGVTGDIQGFKLYDIFDCLSVLLYHITIFDEILSDSNFSNYWPLYKRTVQMVASNEKLIAGNSSASEANEIRYALTVLDYMFSGKTYRTLLDCLFSLKDKIGPKGIGLLVQQFNEYLKQTINNLNKCVNSLLQPNEAEMFIKINSICITFHDFCGQVDNKLIRSLLELNIKAQGIMLIGNIPWQPIKFWTKMAPSIFKTNEKFLSLNMKSLQEQFLQKHLQTFQSSCRNYCLNVSQWTMCLENSFKTCTSDLKVEDLKGIATCLLQGLNYVGQISFLVTGIVYNHVSLQTIMTRSTLMGVCKLIELIKLIQETIESKVTDIAKVLHYILQYLQYKVLNLLAFSKKKVISLKLHDRNVDTLAAIKIAEKCLSGPTTLLRIFLCKVALNSTNLCGRILSTDQLEKLQDLMHKMTLLCDFQEHFENSSIALFLYWHQSLLSAYLKQVIEHKLDFQLFQKLIITSDDNKKLLERLQLKEMAVTKNLSRSNFEASKKEIISNLCALTENFLRLETHYNLQLKKMHPFEESIDDYRDLIQMCPIEINGNYVILKDQVENYLSSMFYNMTTISLHDWKTYEQMRHLADRRFDLEAVPSYLPNQTLEQGIDILEIMRNIHIFVSRYVYNMHSQLFVEQNSQNKHLESITIQHIANSLRTHGTGVINTTINFTYQFLRQKFYTFSQFLYDEQIRSRLMKEMRSFSEKKQENKFPLYPYEKADAFNKEIRKLGLAAGGQTYLDLFRKVITHVGNAMGYVRLIRSGSIQANYSASIYLPSFDDNWPLTETCEKLNASEATKNAAENLQKNIHNLTKSFSDNADYFKILVEAFQPFFRNSHNLHLKNFFLIIPPLTINYVEYMLSVKDKINKKDRRDTILFDDGFAMGLAYILKLLNQFGDFNSLHWFSTVKARFEDEKRKIKVMLEELSKKDSKKNSKNSTDYIEDEKLQQTLALTERRIIAHQIEYNLLYYNLSSAKIFFQ